MEFGRLHMMVLLISLLPVAHPQAKPKPSLRVTPQTSVYTGDTVTLSCEMQETDGWEFLWYKNNQDSKSLNTVATNTNTLSVTVNTAEETAYTCMARRQNTFKDNYTELSDPVNIVARERPPSVLSVSPQNWLTEGDSVTLSCKVTDSSTDWTFSWYTVVPYANGLTKNKDGYFGHVKPLSDSSRGSGGSYTLSPASFNHTGVYMCRGERGEPAFHTPYSNLQHLWIDGESPPVSLIISPSRTQHFTHDSLSLSCEDQSNSTGWTVRRYTDSEGVFDCSQWGSVTGSTCHISFLSTSHTGVYWCESESGGNSNPVNITIHDGDVILGSPAHYVLEGHPLNLHCIYRYTNPPNLRSDFYKDGSVSQAQTTGEMIIHKVLKSDEGFYHCEHPESAESPKSWISVRRSGSGIGIIGLAVGLSLAFLFILSLSFFISLWCRKRKKGTDAEPNDNFMTYADLKLNPMKKENRTQGFIHETESVGDEIVYSKLQQNMEGTTYADIN